MARNRSAYEQVWEGESFTITNKKRCYLQCCDCGLVHRAIFKPQRGGIMCTMNRDNCRTASVRRGKDCKERIKLLKGK